MLNISIVWWFNWFNWGVLPLALGVDSLAGKWLQAQLAARLVDKEYVCLCTLAWVGKYMLCICIYIYNYIIFTDRNHIYICMYVCVCIYIYIHVFLHSFCHQICSSKPWFSSEACPEANSAWEMVTDGIAYGCDLKHWDVGLACPRWDCLDAELPSSSLPSATCWLTNTATNTTKIA